MNVHNLRQMRTWKISGVGILKVAPIEPSLISSTVRGSCQVLYKSKVTYSGRYDKEIREINSPQVN